MSFNSRLLRTLAAAALVAIPALGIVSCGDDAPTNTPTPRYAPITVMHAVSDIATTGVDFKVGSTVIADNAQYGAPTTAQGLVGTSTVVAVYGHGTTNSPGSAAVNIDTNRLVWVIYSGSVLATPRSDVAFGISVVDTTDKIATGGNAAVRFINALSSNTKLDVKLNTASGFDVFLGLDYKNGSPFKAIDTATANINPLVIVRAGTTTSVLTIDLKDKLQAKKAYTVVLYGDVAGTGPAAPAYKLVAEP